MSPVEIAVLVGGIVLLMVLLGLVINDAASNLHHALKQKTNLVVDPKLKFLLRPISR